jgi:hypothetical protein
LNEHFGLFFNTMDRIVRYPNIFTALLIALVVGLAGNAALYFIANSQDWLPANIMRADGETDLIDLTRIMMVTAMAMVVGGLACAGLGKLTKDSGWMYWLILATIVLAVTLIGPIKGIKDPSVELVSVLELMHVVPYLALVRVLYARGTVEGE